MDTRKELVEELLKVPSTPLIDDIIREARAGHFHDYKSPHVCGKVYAVSRLRQAGLEELALRVIDGDFDEEADQEDIEDMRKFAPKELWPTLGL